MDRKETRPYIWLLYGSSLGLLKFCWTAKLGKIRKIVYEIKSLFLIVVFVSFCQVCHVFLLKHSQPGNFLLVLMKYFLWLKNILKHDRNKYFISQCSVRFADFCVSLYWFFKDGKTPYFYAESNKDEKMVELLNDIKKEEKG